MHSEENDLMRAFRRLRREDEIREHGREISQRYLKPIPKTVYDRKKLKNNYEEI